MTTTLTPSTADYQRATWLPWLRHSLTLAGRSIQKMIRHPEQFIDVTLQPILFLVIFVYVLGGAISGSTHAYLQFVLPGILAQTVLFSTVSIGVNLNTDIREGVFDRFRSMPIPRGAPLVGATIAELLRYSLSIIMAILGGVVMGFRFHTSIGHVLLGAGLILAFAWCLCWVSILLGMVSRESGSVQGFGFMVLMPLTFGSSMFAKPSTMPDWLKTWVEMNPVSHLVNAVRALFIGGDWVGDATRAMATALVILLVAAPLAVRAYLRKA